jgi:hypothetical protein
MKRKILIPVVVAAFTLGALPAQAGIFEFFFPMLKNKGDDPAQTLVAPFAEQPAGPPAPPVPGQPAPAKPAQPLPENAIALDKPNRSTGQVADWTASIAAETMTFVNENAAADLAATEKYFDAGGRAQYVAFLKDNNIQKVIDLKKYFVRSYVKESPLLLNEGPAGGRYHWLFEVPVMVSYLDRSVTDYKKATPINQMIIMKVQIGRSDKASDPTGLVIEHWSGKGVKPEKK